MSVADLKQEVEKMEIDELDSMARHIFRLQLQRDPELKKEWARRIDDKSEGAWISAEDIEAQLKQLEN